MLQTDHLAFMALYVCCHWRSEPALANSVVLACAQACKTSSKKIFGLGSHLYGTHKRACSLGNNIRALRGQLHLVLVSNLAPLLLRTRTPLHKRSPCRRCLSAILVSCFIVHAVRAAGGCADSSRLPARQSAANFHCIGAIGLLPLHGACLSCYGGMGICSLFCACLLCHGRVLLKSLGSFANSVWPRSSREMDRI